MTHINWAEFYKRDKQEYYKLIQRYGWEDIDDIMGDVENERNKN